MAKMTQSFKNRTDRPWFVNLELSTARYRLNPGEELILIYDPTKDQDVSGASMRIEIIRDGQNIEMVVWTSAGEMFFADGRPAPQDFGSA